MVNSFNLLQSFNYMPNLFYKKRFKSEINSFCIWTQEVHKCLRKWSTDYTPQHNSISPMLQLKIVCRDIYFPGIRLPKSIWLNGKMLPSVQSRVWTSGQIFFLPTFSRLYWTDNFKRKILACSTENQIFSSLTYLCKKLILANYFPIDLVLETNLSRSFEPTTLWSWA